MHFTRTARPAAKIPARKRNEFWHDRNPSSKKINLGAVKILHGKTNPDTTKIPTQK